MPRDWDSKRICTALADVGAGRNDWSGCLEALSQSVGAAGAILLSTNNPSVVVTTESIEDCTRRYVAEGWHARDLRFRGLAKIKRSGIAVDQDFTTEEEMRRSAYYNDFLGRHGLKWSACIGIPTASNSFAISFQRTAGQDRFSDAEQSALIALRPSVHAAIQSSELINEVRAKGVIEGMAVLQTAAFLLNSSGQVVHQNGPARGLCKGPDFRVGRGGRLMVATSKERTAQLERRIRAVVANWGGAHLDSPVAVQRSGGAMGQSSLVYVTPLPSDGASLPTASLRAIVFVVDASRKTPPPAHHLTEVFGLTPAEARFALSLGRTFSIERTAAELRITKETARSHLRTVFAKTETSRQSELLALLAQFLAQ